MVRAGVNVGPDPYYNDPYYNGVYFDGYWYGPGWYYGNYYNDYPTYYAWRRRNYTGRPYYYHRRHK